jgi:hypothetical protein
MNSDRVLFFMLRVNAAVLLLAAPCALLPFSWMDTVHRDWLGLGPLPDAAITRYLTRSLSLVYAMHGVVVLAVTRDWRRYRPFVPVLAWLHISFGCAMLVVDFAARLPWWWTASEGPSLTAYGIAVLLVYRRASRNEPGVP